MRGRFAGKNSPFKPESFQSFRKLTLDEALKAVSLKYEDMDLESLKYFFAYLVGYTDTVPLLDQGDLKWVRELRRKEQA